MEKPTLEEVKEYFKNAHKCIDWNKDIFTIELDKIKDTGMGWVQNPRKDNWGVLWIEQSGYAKILTYKNPEFRPIAMKCTQEQFDMVKQKLCKYGFEVDNITSFEKDNYLVNNGFGKEKYIVNFGFYSTKFYRRELHETWDEKVFLEASGIEVQEEETFVITKEQIKEIYQYAGANNQHNLESWFPKVFKEDKKEVVLEVGKWYKKENLLCLIKWIDPQGMYFQRFHCYGFNTPTGYDNFCFDVNNGFNHGFELATPQEVAEALEKEAVRRGYSKENTWVKSLITENRMLSMEENTYNKTGYRLETNGHFIFNGVSIFKEGKWAEIIPTITIKEAEEKLNNEFKIVEG